jgi:ketosteroid isomerase-like protein
MSEENIEIYTRMVRLFETGDWDGFGAVFVETAGLWGPDDWPERGPFFGRPAVVEQFRRLHESWGKNHVLIEHHSDHGDWLLVRIRWVVEGAASELPVEMVNFHAVLFEGGQITEFHGTRDRVKALEAAGLRE